MRTPYYVIALALLGTGCDGQIYANPKSPSEQTPTSPAPEAPATAPDSPANASLPAPTEISPYDLMAVDVSLTVAVSATNADHTMHSLYVRTQKPNNVELGEQRTKIRSSLNSLTYTQTTGPNISQDLHEGVLYAWLDANSDGVCNEPVYEQNIDVTNPDPKSVKATGTGIEVTYEKMSQGKPLEDGCKKFKDTANDDNFTIQFLNRSVDTHGIGSIDTVAVTDQTTQQKFTLIADADDDNDKLSARRFTAGHSYTLKATGKAVDKSFTVKNLNGDVQIPY